MHLCIAGSIRAMPEKEKPPAMPVDIYLQIPFYVFTVGLQTICEKQENLFIYILTKSVTNFIIYMFMLVFSNPFL